MDDRDGLESKYVIYRISEYEEAIIVFPFFLRHSIFAHLKPTRAGFVSFKGGKSKCFGDSATLKLESDGVLDSYLADQYILNVKP